MSLNGEWLHIKWHVDDVLQQAREDGREITRKQALEVLEWLDSNHDACIGVNWEVISCAIDEVVEND